LEGFQKTAESKYFNKFFFILSLFVFTVAVIRAIVVPFCNDESTTFFDFAQNGDFLPYHSIIIANNHFLNSFFVWICFHLFGDSPLALRLPNLLALLILIFATYRLAGKLTQTSAKIILVAGLLLSFHWLSFFNMCRGYGLSMSFMVLALSYIPDYLEDKRLAHILKIYALLTLAVCANLAVILTAVTITGFVCLFQLYKRQFFKAGNIVALLLYTIVILYWIKYLFFLQHHNSLHSGPAGNSYWEITFESIINTIAGKQNFWINLSAIMVFTILMLMCCFFLVKNKKGIQTSRILFLIFMVMLLNGLIIEVYLLRKLLGIEYPQDRTALIFYLLFILNAAFIIDITKPYISKPIAVAVFSVFMIHFAWSLNFNRHPFKGYNVIPQKYYDCLLVEQKQNSQRITIQANDFFEPIYGFMNYKHNGALNYMDYRDSMLMDADYYIAVKRAGKYYTPYYREIDSDKNNDFVLLKRKEPLTRTPVFAIGGKHIAIDTNIEYYDFFEIKDTLFNEPNPLMVELNFKVLKGEMPSFFSVVLSIDSVEGKTAFYGRIPFNRVKYNWLGTEKSEDLILETGILPKKVHRLVCYLWNAGHQKVEIEMNSVRAFQLEGSGVCVRARSIEIIPPR
jgi:hypothetical protein